MVNPTAKRRVIRHVLANICSIGFFAAAPLALYCAVVIPAAVTAEDLGGPLNFVIIPLAGGIIGCVLGVMAFLPLGLLAEKLRFPIWLKSAGVSVALLILLIASLWFFVHSDQKDNSNVNLFLILFSLCLYAASGFFVHLICLAVCRRISPEPTPPAIPKSALLPPHANPP
jgi:hypothetical protein